MEASYPNEMMWNRRVIEDAVELCLAETMDAKNKEDAVNRIKSMLGVIKTSKFERMRKYLGIS